MKHCLNTKINFSIYILNNKKNNNEINSSNHTKSKNETKTEKTGITSFNLKKEINTGKNILSINLNKNIFKNISLYINEKLLNMLIKFYKKYFITNEFDKFTFLQLVNNWKISLFIKFENLSNFLTKLRETKNSF